MAKNESDAKDEVKAAGAEELQKQVDEAHAKGYVGEKVDPTPDSEYTLQGVTKQAKSE